jgi:predicted RNA-binding protein with PUA-like domain
MKYWLMKSEPGCFSIDDLAKRPKRTEHWDGVRNYQARNMMRDEMRKGDKAFFYHSNCESPGIVGVVEIVKEAYPDFTAFDLNQQHYDPKSTRDNPRWFMVDVQFLEKFSQGVSLEELKQNPYLKNLMVLRKGSRLSITPVAAEEWKLIVTLAKSSKKRESTV